MLELINVIKEYHGAGGITKALKGISLKIEAGENIALTGRSGSGKTTLLLLAAAVFSPDKGKIIYQQQNIASFNSRLKNNYRLKNITLVLQSDNLLPFMSLMENYHLSEMASGLERSSEISVKKVFAEAAIADKIHSYPFELSSGESQRAAILIGLAAGAQILLLDEPTANLDRENSRVLTELLQKKSEQGTTIIAATHDLELASSFARIIELDDGEIHSDKRK